MKLFKTAISTPKKLFKSRFVRFISRSDNETTASASDSSGSQNGSRNPDGLYESTTPKTILPPSDFSTDFRTELVQAFNLIDRDGDGKIQREELAALLSLVGAEPPSEEEIDVMMGEVDADGDGCISLEEFAALGSAFALPSCQSEVRDTFDFFDTDRDGKITAEELFRVFKSIGDGRCTLEDCRRMIRGVGGNENGFVCFEDFSRMMEQRI